MRHVVHAPSPRGILSAPRPDGLLEGRRALPSASLSAHVHHFWSVGWSLRSPHTVTTLPQPAALVIVTPHGAELHGVQTGRVTRRLTNGGRMFGVTFRPVMFQPLLRAPLASLTDEVVPLESVLGSRSKTWARAIRQARDLETEVRITEEYLGELVAPPSALLVKLRDLVERMASDREILRVEDLCLASGVDARTLQRHFRTYVGMSPKGVIRRYRLHEAAAQLATENPPALANLAMSLGYADQAHFARDFKHTVGETPQSFVSTSRASLTRARRAG